MVAQDLQQRRRLRRADLAALAVYGEGNVHDGSPIRRLHGLTAAYPLPCPLETPWSSPVTNRAHVLLWTDSSSAYLDAIKAAGLSDRVAIDTLPRKERPSADQLARTEALMAGAVPAGLLPKMPKLRWAQAMSAGVEGWLALPDLPSGLTLTCARGTHTESMPEHIVGALFRPYSTAVENQKMPNGPHRRPAADRQDAGHPGLRHRPEVACIVIARHAVIGTRRRLAPTAIVVEVPA